MFNFKEQFKVGNQGEKLFLKLYQDRKPIKAENQSFDFWIDKDKKVELKTDTYAMDKTDNFFMEQYGNITTQPKSLGGPWRALRDDIDYFIYFYIKNRTFFWFEPASLCDYLDGVTHKLKPKYIKNESYTGLGYLIKRKKVENIWIAKHVFDVDGTLQQTNPF